MKSLDVTVDRSQTKRCNGSCWLITGLEIGILGVLNEVMSFENINSVRLKLTAVEKDLGVMYICHLKWLFGGGGYHLQILSRV